MFNDLVKKKKKVVSGIIWDVADYKKNPKCIECDSKNIEEQKMHIVNQFFEKLMKCKDCGKKWYVTHNSIVPTRE